MINREIEDIILEMTSQEKEYMVIYAEEQKQYRTEIKILGWKDIFNKKHPQAG